MSSAARWLVRSLTAVLVAMAAGPVGTAIAIPPSVTITSPLNGSVSNNPTPYFSGLAEGAGTEVTLRIYDGTPPEGLPFRK